MAMSGSKADGDVGVSDLRGTRRPLKLNKHACLQRTIRKLSLRQLRLHGRRRLQRRTCHHWVPMQTFRCIYRGLCSAETTMIGSRDIGYIERILRSTSNPETRGIMMSSRMRSTVSRPSVGL